MIGTLKPGTLKSYEFRQEREPSWRELERLVAQHERNGGKSLSAGESSRLAVLYRAALSSLSVARAISLDRNVLDYLEGLCGRAHACVYGVRRGWIVSLRQFVAVRLPSVVRASGMALLVSGGFMLLGTIVGAAMVALDMEWFYSLVPAGLANGRNPSSTTASLRDALYPERWSSDELAFFSSMLFTHNAQVGIVSFALGFLAGLPTAIMLFTNGLILGAFAALYASRGLGVELWAWLLPHGVPELFAITMCGAGGLVIARALVFPGRHSRLENLAIRGREAGVLVMGAVLLLFGAGLIEGIFRQTVHAVPVRYAVACAGALGLLLWFGRSGKVRT